MNEQDFTKKYEATTQTSYAEFGKKNKEFRNWGIAKRGGQYFEFYTDSEYIKKYFTNSIIGHLKQRNVELNENLKLVDFGGGDGVLIKELNKQFKKAGYPNITAINFDYTYKNLEKVRENDSERDIFAVQGNIAQLSLKPNFVDVGVSRHVIQYFGKNQQPEILKNIYDSLKNGSVFVMQWPGAKGPEQSAIMTDFYAQIAAIISDSTPEEVAKNKYFVSYQEIEEIAKQVGFKVVEAGRCEEELGGLTTKGFSNRFKVTDEQQKQFDKIFTNFFEKYKDMPEIFEMVKDKEGVIYSVWHHNFIVLEK